MYLIIRKKIPKYVHTKIKIQEGPQTNKIIDIQFKFVTILTEQSYTYNINAIKNYTYSINIAFEWAYV